MFSTMNESCEEQYSVEINGKTAVFRYAPAVAQTVFGGMNIALGCRAVSATGADASVAVDGNPDTNWVCDRDDNAWLQLDLGAPAKLGRIEIWARSGVDELYTDAERLDMRILAGNKEDMSDGAEIARLDAIPFPKHGAWTADVHSRRCYRYLRLERLWGMDKICSVFDMAPLGLSEIRVYEEGTGVVSVLEKPVDGAQMIIASDGKALTCLADGRAVADTYRFRNAQRFLVSEEGKFLRILNTEGLALTAGKATLAWEPLSRDKGQLWSRSPIEGNWVRLTSANGRVLSLVDNQLALTAGGEPKAERFDISPAYVEDLPHGSTDVIRRGYGAMYHLLIGQQESQTVHTKIDVPAIADTFKANGVKYMILTTGQGTGAVIAPSTTYPTIVKSDPELRNPAEDIFGSFCDELGKRDIDMVAYATAFPPKADAADFGQNPDVNEPISPESTMLWSFVLRDWSRRYGKKIKGWWVDGGYVFFFNKRENLLYLCNAMRTGNPDAAIAISNGLALYPNPNFENDDYTAGEVDFPFSENGWRTCFLGMVNTNLREIPDAFFRDKDSRTEVDDPSKWLTPANWPLKTEKQWFALTHIETGWCHNNGPRKALYDKKIWGEYVKTVLEQKGSICLDCNFDTENGYLPTDATQAALAEVNHALYGTETAEELIIRILPVLQKMRPVAEKKEADPAWRVYDQKEEWAQDPIVAFFLSNFAITEICDTILAMDAAARRPETKYDLVRFYEQEKMANNTLGTTRKMNYSYGEMIRFADTPDLVTRIDRILTLMK